MIQIEDLAYTWQTWYELGLIIYLFINGKKISRPFFTFFLGRGGVLNQMGLQLLSHLKPTTFQPFQITTC
jgi:hypothetical protein